jgi:protein NUD1
MGLDRMNPCTLGWYLPLLVKDLPGALQPSEGKKGSSHTSAWQDMDVKFRRDLPDDAYVGRLAYRGLIMRACPRIRLLDGVAISEKERAKAQELLANVLGKKKLKKVE